MVTDSLFEPDTFRIADTEDPGKLEKFVVVPPTRPILPPRLGKHDAHPTDPSSTPLRAFFFPEKAPRVRVSPKKKRLHHLLIYF